MRTPVVLSASLVLVAASLGCDEELTIQDWLPEQANAEAQQAADSTNLGSLEAALLASATAALSIVDSEEAMAAEAATQLDATLQPPGCVESVTAGATVTFTMNECSGPYGLARVSGVANLAFTVAGLGSTSVALTAADLQVNGATLAVNVSGGMSTNDNGERVWELISSGGGVSSSGLIVTRTGSFGMVTDNTCIRLNGGWTTTIGESAWATTITNFRRCDGACPESGTIVWAGAELDGGAEIDGRAVTVTFDGDDTAAWVTSRGRVGQSEIACEVGG